MNKLAKSLLVGLLENESEVVALYGGGFKPPTKGHFEVVEKTLRDHPEITKFYIVIGSGVRNNITQDESYSIWNIYKQYLPSQVEIVTSQSPLKYIKDYLEENPDIKTYAILGTREGNEGDIEDFVKRKDFFEKYGENVEVLNIVTGDGISGTNARKAATQSKEEFFKYIPTQLTDKEKNTVFGYVASVIKENLETSKFDYSPKIQSLTKYMITQGLNIQPLPKVKFVKDDDENAKDFFGKTAYYDSNNRIIVLYTMNRHPKDIMRSFAHEMIHHMQNCEGRLSNITTQNTNEGGDLPEIEREAYEKGNMYFRNWEDSIKNPSIYVNESEKHNYPKLFHHRLHESISELNLSGDNVGNINGDSLSGEFNIGDMIYVYNIVKIKNPYSDKGLFYNIEFNPKGNKTDEPTGNISGGDYVRVLNTMYKIIKDFINEYHPEYVGISSMDNDYSKNYHNIYANLVKNNNIPGYFKKDNNLLFTNKDGNKGRIIVLKKSKSNLTEGRYDKISNQISSTIFNEWKEDFENGEDSSRVNKLFPFEENEIDVDANISFIPELNDLNVDGGADSETDYLEIRFEVDPKLLPKMWSEISMNLKDVVRHEIEHLTHGEGSNLKPGKFIEDDQLIRNLIDAKLLPKSEYFKLEKEIDAQLQGMYFRAKKEKRPFIDVLDTYLNSQNITPEEKEEVLDIWRTRAKALSLPKF
jgi:nicotinamide mononucleotide adenylyltransferase